MVTSYSVPGMVRHELTGGANGKCWFPYWRMLRQFHPGGRSHASQIIAAGELFQCSVWIWPRGMSRARFLCLRRASSAGVYTASGKATWKASAALMHLAGYFIHGCVFGLIIWTKLLHVALLGFVCIMHHVLPWFSEVTSRFRMHTLAKT